MSPHPEKPEVLTPDQPPAPSPPPPSFVKLAMRNMVKKGGQSLRHFGLTVLGLLALLVGLAYLTR
jgi:hypothetical protein